jgi:hypothetical protein
MELSGQTLQSRDDEMPPSRNLQFKIEAQYLENEMKTRVRQCIGQEAAAVERHL